MIVTMIMMKLRLHCARKPYEYLIHSMNVLGTSNKILDFSENIVIYVIQNYIEIVIFFLILLHTFFKV